MKRTGQDINALVISSVLVIVDTVDIATVSVRPHTLTQYKDVDQR